MASERYEPDFEAAGSWAKKYFLASRALMESLLRPYGLGTTQWYVLSLLVHEGPITQRELTSRLEVERATLSGVVAALVRKDLVVQVPNAEDQRQKTLKITAAGERLWASLPDPAQVIADTAFAGLDADDVATMNRVLREATQRLVDHRRGAREL